MSPTEIKINLIVRNVSQAEIANNAGVSRACVTMVIQRKAMSKRVRGVIAEALGIDYDKVWGEEVAA